MIHSSSRQGLPSPSEEHVQSYDFCTTSWRIRADCLMLDEFIHDYQGNRRIPRWIFLIIQWGTHKFFRTLISFFRSFISFFRTFISALCGEFSFAPWSFLISSWEKRIGGDVGVAMKWSYSATVARFKPSIPLVVFIQSECHAVFSTPKWTSFNCFAYLRRWQILIITK